jgi:pyrroloquinoline quinone (PQQ) biosynthesis protein C
VSPADDLIEGIEPEIHEEVIRWIADHYPEVAQAAMEWFVMPLEG